jgi:hypothetical protein
MQERSESRSRTGEVDLRHLELRYTEVPGGGYLGIVNERETERMGTSKNKSLAESLHYFMYSMERVCPASDKIGIDISACLGRSIDGTACYSFFGVRSAFHHPPALG